MITIPLDLVAAPAKDSAPVTGASKKARNAPSVGVGVDPFRSLIPGVIVTQPPVVPAKTAAGPAESAATNVIAAAIKKRLDAGTTQAEITATLANQLAANVADKLGISSADARSKLQAVFSASLAPPGSELATNAATATAFAQRYKALETVALDIANQTNGQQNRLSGNILDAPQAKDLPALATSQHQPIEPPNPSVGSVGLPASSAGPAKVRLAPAAHAVEPASTPSPPRAPGKLSTPVPAPTASSLSDSETPSAAPIPPSSPPAQSPIPTPQTLASLASLGSLVEFVSPAIASGDGRTAKHPGLQAIATGGDSVLGRILTRAAAVAAVRTTALTVRDSTQIQGPSSSSTSSPSESSVAQEPALAAFLRTFAAALATNDPEPAHLASLPSDRPPVLEKDPSPEALPIAPIVSPFRVESVPATASAAVISSAPVDHASIADQVLRGAFLRATDSGSEIRLSLVPASLGDVSVKLTLSGDSVSAHVIADTPAVRDALVAAQPQLTKTLAEAGLKLTGFAVDLAGGGFAESGPQREPRDRPAPTSRIAPIDRDDGADFDDDARLDAIPTFGPATAGSLSDFNYLT